MKVKELKALIYKYNKCSYIVRTRLERWDVRGEQYIIRMQTTSLMSSCVISVDFLHQAPKNFLVYKLDQMSETIVNAHFETKGLYSRVSNIITASS